MHFLHQYTPLIDTSHPTQPAAVIGPVGLCPSDALGNYTYLRETTKANGRNNPSYGVNFKVTRNGSVTGYSSKMNQVKSPGKTIFVTDSLHRYNDIATRSDDASCILAAPASDVALRHNNNANILWVGGHVSAITEQERNEFKSTSVYVSPLAE